MTIRIVLLAGCLFAAGALVSCSDDTPTEPVNAAPVIATLACVPVTVEVGTAAAVTCTASDDDGDVLTYTWTSTAGTISGTAATVSWTAPATVGAQSVTCLVSDGEDSASESVAVIVFEPVVPGAMVTVTVGTFDMGDSYGEGAAEELPVHSVSVGNFKIGKYEVTQSEWDALMADGTYDVGAGATHPAYNNSWFEIIMYCNLRSVDEGLTPCYVIQGSTDPSDWPAPPVYTSDTTFAVWDAVDCDWSANGYRLPTEAEWEFAARGGVHAADDHRYSGGGAIDDVAWYGDNAVTACQAVGGKLPNQLGIYDMSGNVYEFCWDRFGEQYYAACNTLGTVADPLGPTVGDMRVERGGGWGGAAANCRVAGRYRDYPVSAFSHTGFRVVRMP